MRFGLIARAEADRGLGVLTRQLYENLHPDKTLLLTLDSGYEQDTYAFPDALVMHFDGELPELAFKDWADGLDVVISCETFYDWRAIDWCRDLGIATVLYVMPELLKKEIGTDLPAPDVYWYPTTWRLDKCPPGVVLPVPCQGRSFAPLPDGGPIKMIHVAGKQALGDRNGTDTVLLNLNRVPRAAGFEFTVYSQTPGRTIRNARPGMQVAAGPDDKWQMYEDAHLLVMPRRFGGLCLPVIEALSCGVGLVMPLISPNQDWPIHGMTVTEGRRYEMPCGKVTTYDTEPTSFVRAVNQLANDRYRVRDLMLDAQRYAVANTWEQRRQDFMEAIEDAANHASR